MARHAARCLEMITAYRSAQVLADRQPATLILGTDGPGGSRADDEQAARRYARLGSTSPYVGLFGTVWGIMTAFHNLGNVQQATLAAVAPGIAEALIATAIGLFAAIPAVVAYNRFADQVSRLELRFDTFVEEFSTILQRHGPARAPQA